MRTTITIEPDLAAMIKREMALGKRTLKEIVNSNLRKSLLGSESGQVREPFKVVTHSSDFMPGVDPAKLGQLSDELEAGEALKRL